MRKQPGYTIFLTLTILSTLAAISTLIPEASASKVCLLGYRAHCIWAPWSTVICLIVAGISCSTRVRKFKAADSTGTPNP